MNINVQKARKALVEGLYTAAVSPDRETAQAHLKLGASWAVKHLNAALGEVQEADRMTIERAIRLLDASQSYASLARTMRNVNAHLDPEGKVL